MAEFSHDVPLSTIADALAYIHNLHNSLQHADASTLKKLRANMTSMISKINMIVAHNKWADTADVMLFLDSIADIADLLAPAKRPCTWQSNKTLCLSVEAVMWMLSLEKIKSKALSAWGDREYETVLAKLKSEKNFFERQDRQAKRGVSKEGDETNDCDSNENKDGTSDIGEPDPVDGLKDALRARMTDDANEAAANGDSFKQRAIALITDEDIDDFWRMWVAKLSARFCKARTT
jgi:hypothetical protein